MILRNPLAGPVEPIAPGDGPYAFHRRLPGYAPRPAVDLADPFGLRSVAVKDESDRFGLPSFKMLGASWATYRTLLTLLGHEPEWSTVDELADGLVPLRPLTLTTATDGNHGRAVARMAALLGFAARIYVPDDMVPARIAAIEDEGAEVVVVDGTYDEAVAAAVASGDVVVADTGEGEAPARVIEGYSTMFRELGDRRFDAVFFPVGVGALAAAVVTAFRPGDTVLVAVQASGAPCLVHSLEMGQVATLPGEPRTIMAGISCGTPSPVAWPLVSRGVDWVVTVTDDQARDAMRALAREGIVSGETGAAALAGLLEVLATKAEGPDLSPDSAVLVLSTEGATDPVAYEEIVGRAP
ncbi:MAG: pyridoxal-phosphate dependent enzyme [Acidimicrobiales bacterium]